MIFREPRHPAGLFPIADPSMNLPARRRCSQSSTLTHHSSLPLLRCRRLRHETQRFLNVDLSCFLTETRAGHVVVDFETVPIHAREDVAEGVVGQSEQQIMFAAHVALAKET